MHPSKRKLVLSAIVAMIALALLVNTVLAVGETISRGAFTAASGSTSTGSVKVIFALGQPVAGPVSSGDGSQSVCSGIICGSPETMGSQLLYLPLLRR